MAANVGITAEGTGVDTRGSCLLSLGGEICVVAVYRTGIK